MLTALLIAGAVVVVFAIILRASVSSRQTELRGYGITPEIKEQARTVEPDLSAPEPVDWLVFDNAFVEYPAPDHEEFA